LTVDLTNKNLIELYRLLVLSRRLEEGIVETYRQGKAVQLVHASIGQEAVGVGACYGLRPDDYIVPHLRTRPSLIVRGMSPKTILAISMGKWTKEAGGKTSTHHVPDLNLGVIAGSGIVGASIPIAVGVGLALKFKKKDQVVLSFFGDGMSNRGDFHEAANLAAIWKLPVLFICENNLYALSEGHAKYLAIENIADRAVGYGFEGLVVDGNDVLAIHETVQKAVRKAREGKGPTLIECKTYRWRGHREGRPDQRSKEEVEIWKAKCPIKRFEKVLIEKGVLTPQLVSEIAAKVEEEYREALKFAEEAPYPKPEDAVKNVYVGEIPYGN